jgi:hypothetical protein
LQSIDISQLPEKLGMSTRHHGSCLCGDVRFEIEGNFEAFYLCHCEYCQKDTGSAHAANLFSSSARLLWISGEDKVKSFRLPSTRHSKGFCITCGSALPNLQGDLLEVPAGSLDSTLAMRPNAHLFIMSKAQWDQDLESVPMMEKFPN